MYKDKTNRVIKILSKLTTKIGIERDNNQLVMQLPRMNYFCRSVTMSDYYI
jgi:hypothetical protein